jgi:Fic family protein
MRQGSVTRIWAEKGTRPRAVRQQQFEYGYIFGVVCPAKDKALGLMLPVEILKKSISANRALAILNETAKSVPNRFILINALTLQEAKDSSEIENIITTHDELYKADLDLKSATKEAKEVKGYQSALLQGVDLINNGILSINDIVKIQGILENNDAGIRTQVGTKLKNDKTGEVIYEPPQDYQEIIKLFNNLESYINEKNDLDSLINMAIIHYQFEAIHPFYDGNGRTGRIINILYLMLNDLLDLNLC